MKKKILELISLTGTHPSFNLPPVSFFISKLKEILEEEKELSKEEVLDKSFGPYEKDDPRAKRGW